MSCSTKAYVNSAPLETERDAACDDICAMIRRRCQEIDAELNQRKVEAHQDQDTKAKKEGVSDQDYAETLPIDIQRVPRPFRQHRFSLAGATAELAAPEDPFCYASDTI